MSQFKVKDLLISVIPEAGKGGVSLCYDTSATVPTPLTPWVLVAAYTPVFDTLEHAGRRFAEASDSEGDRAMPDLDAAAQEIGRAFVAHAFVQGGAGYPSPDCGSSRETIPTPLTPVIHKNLELLQPRHLTQLKTQLRKVHRAVDAAEDQLTPSGAEQVRLLRGKLEGALEELSR